MPKVEIPRFVPLPNVPEFSDDIVFGGLNLPVGFDDERLLVNVRGINRVRTMAGIGQVGVFCSAADTQDSFTIAGTDASGAASLVKIATKTDTTLSKGTIVFNGSSNEYLGKPDVVVRVNASEIDERLKASAVPRSILDARLRGKILNASLKHGLSEAAFHANIDRGRTMTSLRGYGFLGGVVLLNGGGDLQANTFLFSMGTVLNYLSFIRAIAENNLIQGVKGNENKTSIKDALNAFRHTVFIGNALDRYAAARIALGSTQLIKGRK